MPSPFPGMDPYLENPNLFMGIQQALVTFLCDEMNQMLPTNYVSSICERNFWDSDSALDDRREAFIEIVPVGGEGEVITLIEVLSPSNKSRGTPGHDTYIEKQQTILQSDTHLIEIDLLRDGLHTVAADRDEIAVQAHFDYCVCLSRAYGSAAFEVWARTVRQSLPRFRVPLKAEDKDVVINLQALFDHCYEAGNFARRINYQNEPSLPLRLADAEWTDALLREKGARH